ncbi:MAG: NAD(P)H-dependent oxidoreductase subunit E [bacterium]|nr:NAD(P)H-dependent oxidoreductase subunit E [bacterium]
MGEIERVAAVLHSYPRDPRYLLAVLLEIQEGEKYLSTEAMRETALYLSVPESRVYAVATFYSTLSLKKKGKKNIRVCMGTACHLKGAAALLKAFEKELGVAAGETTADGRYTLETVNCVGACALAPVSVCGDRTYSRMSAASVREMLEKEAAL